MKKETIYFILYSNPETGRRKMFMTTLSEASSHQLSVLKGRGMSIIDEGRLDECSFDNFELNFALRGIYHREGYDGKD